MRVKLVEGKTSYKDKGWFLGDSECGKNKMETRRAHTSAMYHGNNHHGQRPRNFSEKNRHPVGGSNCWFPEKKDSGTEGSEIRQH